MGEATHVQGQEGKQETSVPSPQFCCKPISALKKKNPQKSKN